jgi:hypothetical protein
MWREKRMLARGFALSAMISLGCAAVSLERVREHVYPRDFHYITQQEIRTTMGALASEVDALDRIMWQSGGPRLDDRARVVEILSRMQLLAAQLKRREHSNHPRIDMHAEQLQREIERAQVFAKREPPNYYYAGQVSGACSSCHEPRHRLAAPVGLP